VTTEASRTKAEPGGLLLLALVALLCALTILPLWVSRYVPLLDYPFHVSQIFILRHLRDPEWNLARYYEPNLVPLPYWLEYATTYALSLVMPVESAVKVFTAASLLGLPAAVALYCKQLGRDPLLAVFCFPLAWNFSTEFGFLAYIGGLPLLFVSLYALEKNAESPSPRRAALATLLALSLYFSHILILFCVGVLGGLLLPFFVRPLSPRRMLVAVFPLVPAVLLSGAAFLGSRRIGSAAAPHTGRGLFDFEGVYNRPKDSLVHLGKALIDILPCSLDAAVLALLGLCVLLLLFVQTRKKGEAAPGAAGLSRWRAPALFFASAALYFVLPRSLLRPLYWWGVSARVAVIAAVLLLLCVPGRLTGVARLIVLAGGLLSAVFLVDVSLHFHRFGVRARDFDALLAEVPPGKRVLPLFFLRGDPDVSVNAYNHFGAFVQLQKGGYVPENPTLDFPVRARHRLRAPPWDTAEDFRFYLHGEDWDFFLVRDDHVRNLFAGFSQRVVLRRRLGDFFLYERLPDQTH
jgi:hypothetical protein